MSLCGSSTYIDCGDVYFKLHPYCISMSWDKAIKVLDNYFLLVAGLRSLGLSYAEG